MKALAWLWGMVISLAAQSAETAFPLELPTLDGDRFFRLEEVRSRPVVMNFWDVDCLPCRREMPMLNRQAARRPEVAFIGVSLSPRDEARRFLMAHPASYLQLRAPVEAGALLRRLGNPLGALPFTVVFDRRGQRCASQLGAMEESQLDDLLRRCS